MVFLDPESRQIAIGQFNNPMDIVQLGCFAEVKKRCFGLLGRTKDRLIHNSQKVISFCPIIFFCDHLSAKPMSFRELIFRARRATIQQQVHIKKLAVMVTQVSCPLK